MEKIIGFLSKIVMLLIVALLSNCSKDNSDSPNTIQSIVGYAQKGPFISGSSVSIYDLQSDLSPSGKSFNAQITDNKGTFQLSNITLSSNYVSIRADGFYYNEISGKQSAAQITLYALSDISDESGINVNLLTHLEKARVEYLMQQGASFPDSKIQAQREILAIFSIHKNDIISSENLNIAESGDDNGILLAISCILQGNFTEGELTELLSNISEDIKEDGVLNNNALGSALINQAKLLDTSLIKNNLAKRYSDIGADANIPNFEKYLQNFLDSTDYTFTSFIEYPENGSVGPNILSTDRINYPSRTENANEPMCSIAAKLPRGTSIKVIFIPDYIFESGEYSDWAILSGMNGWSYSDTLYVKNRTGIYFNSESDKIIDTRFDLNLHGGAKIEIYENNQSTPTRIKQIYW